MWGPLQAAQEPVDAAAQQGLLTTGTPQLWQLQGRKATRPLKTYGSVAGIWESKRPKPRGVRVQLKRFQVPPEGRCGPKGSRWSCKAADERIELPSSLGLRTPQFYSTQNPDQVLGWHMEIPLLPAPPTPWISEGGEQIHTNRMHWLPKWRSYLFRAYFSQECSTECGILYLTPGDSELLDGWQGVWGKDWGGEVDTFLKIQEFFSIQ